MPLQEDYRVTLETFEGPLDLLLYLIRRAEVDIYDIPVAGITDQYLAFLRQVDDVDVEIAGEFLVMAATLIELKSRTLAPVAEEEQGEGSADLGSDGRSENDPRFELVQQLLAYQRYRTASEALEERRERFSRRLSVHAHGIEREEPQLDLEQLRELELEDLHIMDLADAYEAIMASIDFTRLGDHVVEIDDTPLALHQEDLLDQIEHAPKHRLMLQSAFQGRSRGQRIGLFLAMLELVRLRRVTIRQEQQHSEIEVVLREDEDNAAGADPAQQEDASAADEPGGGDTVNEDH